MYEFWDSINYVVSKLSPRRRQLYRELENLKNVRIVDSTLRDGEQTHRVTYELDRRIMIATKLDEFFSRHPYMMEVGSPYANAPPPHEAKELTKIGLHGELISHARAKKEDIDAAVDSGTEWIGIYLPTSDIHLQYKIHKERKDILRIITDSIEYAKSFGLKVRITAEDSTNTDVKFLKTYARTVEEYEVDRLSIADTKGGSTSERMYNLIRELLREVKIPIDVHCHNDYGLALSNSIAGAKAGANGVHTTVLGLGERAGITKLHQFVVTLYNLYGVNLGIRYDMLPELSDLVSRVTGIFSPVNEPIIGENAFTHKGGVHTDGVAKNPKTYEDIDPALVGRIRRLLAGHMSGWQGIKGKLKNEYRREVDENIAKMINEDVRKEGRDLNEDEFLRIARRYIPDLIGANGVFEIIVDIKTKGESPELERMLRRNLGCVDVYELTGGIDYQAKIIANSQKQLDTYVSEIKKMPNIDRVIINTILRKLK